MRTFNPGSASNKNQTFLGIRKKKGYRRQSQYYVGSGRFMSLLPYSEDHNNCRWHGICFGRALFAGTENDYLPFGIKFDQCVAVYLLCKSSIEVQTYKTLSQQK